MKKLLSILTVYSLLFTVYYQVPFGKKHKYRNVIRVELVGVTWKILTEDRRTIYLPVTWTTVEEL